MSHWTVELSGRRARPPEIDSFGPDAERVRAALGDGALAWAAEVGQDIAGKISSTVLTAGEGAPPLETIRRATTATVFRALTLVARLGDSETALASAEVEEIAREFARRGMDLDDLLRTIRVGYAVLATALLDAVVDLTPPTESGAEIRRISLLLFEGLDDFTGVAAAAFLEEQSAWAAGVSAARFDLASKIIAGDSVEPAHAEKVLGYPLNGHHVAVIAWSGPSSTHDLRSVVGPVLRHWGNPTATLVIPVGLQTVWAWGAVTPDPTVPPARLPEFDDTFVVAGRPGDGLAGIRQSHLEARAVERVVRLRAGHPPTTTAHEDVGLEVLLLADPEAAVRFATGLLGPLAADDPRMADLRSTLSRYLDMDHSLAKVAAAEHISKNTVTYRVQKAMSLCSTSGGSTTELRAALRIREWLRNAPVADW